tara:strand:- start:839 stop:1300 length:462 start_codon:yes stop_codon:yes gene_type:complete
MYNNRVDKKMTTKFEFLLKINGNIICQRYFNVRDFNEKTLDSIELLDEVNYIKSKLKEHLKMRSLNYLYDQYNSYTNVVNLSEQDLEGSEDEVFEIEIRKDGKNIIHTFLPSNCYPTRVRYTVDIRPMIPRILGDLSDTLSLKKPVKVIDLYK